MTTMTKTTTRPYGRLAGSELIPLILAGDPVALEEGQNHRSVPTVKAAIASVTSAPAPVESTPAPASKPARTAAQKRATTLRSKAWDLLVAEKQAARAEGRKPGFNYAGACKMVGVKPAKG